jgi:type IV pilus assembly protein PilQ
MCLRLSLTAFLLWLLLLPVPGSAQTGQKKPFKQYTSPEEIVSLSRSTPFNQAMRILGLVSKKFIGKVIVDLENRTSTIDIDVDKMQWRDALEVILRKNSLWYQEHEDYIMIISLQKETDQTKPDLSETKTEEKIQQKPEMLLPTLDAPQVNISAVFFELDMKKLREVGLNWNFLWRSTSGKYDFSASMGGATNVGSNIFSASGSADLFKDGKSTPTDVSGLLKFFEGNNLGQVISGPRLTVGSGKEGYIQVGADIPITSRDFAGNTLVTLVPTGTIIRIKPTVIVQDTIPFVYIELQAEKSSAVAAAVQVQINRTRAESKLVLLDGEEAMIGGLFVTDETNIREGIPFLKDLPWWFLGLRYVFGYDKVESNRKELIILLKAEIVPSLRERALEKVRKENVLQRERREMEKEMELRSKDDRQ